MRINNQLDTTIIIHTENKEKLLNLLSIINKKNSFNNFAINLNAKGYTPWLD